MNLKTTWRAFTLVAAATVLLPTAVAAQVSAPLRDLSLDDLMGVKVQPVFGASERLQPVTEAPSSVTIVTAADIRRYGYRTLADILRGARGFFVSNDRNYSYVGARGFGLPGDYNTRVLLLLNGHKVNDNVYDQAYIGAELGMDPAMFERVEIIRGPSSSLYGTNAFFAVVNIVTRTGAALNGASAVAEVGSMGELLMRGSFGQELAPGIDLALSGTYGRSDGMQRIYFPTLDSPDTNNGVAENLDGERLRAFYGRLRFNDLTLTATHGRRLKYIPTASFFTLFNNQDPREQTVDSHTLIGAQYERVSGSTRMVADLSYDRRTYEALYPFPGENPDYPVLVNDDNSTGDRWTAGLQVTHPLPGRQTVTAGVELIANVSQNQVSLFNDPLVDDGFVLNHSSRQGAIYVQDEIRLRPWLLLNGGIRHDRYERFAQTTPRGAVIVMPSANQSFKYLYGRAFRAPNVYELYYYNLTTPDLRSESIGTHEVVWEQYAGRWLRTSVSAYRYSASDLISLEVAEGTSLFSGGYAFEGFAFFNRGTVEAKGLELEAEVRSTSGFQALGSFAIQRAVDEDGQVLSNSPREMAKLRFSAPVPLKNAVAAFELQYLAPRRTIAGERVAAMTLANVTFTARVAPTLELLATVNNLFDHRFSDPASDEHPTDTILQNGRTARIGLRWDLWTRKP